MRSMLCIVYISVPCIPHIHKDDDPTTLPSLQHNKYINLQKRERVRKSKKDHFEYGKE